ncbi:MAG TPA: hypothetical protein VGS78_06740 [Candidatus Sulfotelmatobacter sp.]|nr:hypothetical protein [Candidatus Sulfotelmatobacter sp.]
MNTLNRSLWAVVVLLLITHAANAAEPPANLCSLLPVAVVNQVLGATYSSPAKTVAPRPFPNTNEGTDCTYKSSHHTLLFRIYIDPSPKAATDLFAKLKFYFGSGSTPVTNLGDEAYIDANHGLHVRKGKARFFIDGEATNQQRETLATGIAGQL